MNFLQEGIIQVPDHLVAYVKEIVFSMVGNYLGNVFHEKFHHLFTIDGKQITNTKSHLEIDTRDHDSIQGSQYTIDVRDIPYTDKQTDKLVIGVHLKNTNDMYVPEANAIGISVLNVITYIDKITDYPTDDMEELEMYYELVDIFKSINTMLNRVYHNLTGAIKHELAHFIQFVYLSKKHSKQADVASDYDDMEGYFQSDIEQSPYIISAIEVFKFNAPRLKITPTEYFKYLVGMISHRGLFVDDHTVPDNTVRNFFLALKNKNKSKYKKAVRYFMSNI